MRITTLTPDHLDAAVHVLARAFVTNPLHVAVFGPGALEANEAFFRVGFSAMTGDKRLVLDDGRIVGVAHWVDAPGCQFSPVQKIANAVPLLRGCGLRSMAKILPWLSAWSRRDPREPHAHLGPIGVDPDVQGRGVGRLLMEEFCERQDAAGILGYLETDRTENVAFYARFGFEVTETTTLHGVTNYFMRRRPASR